MSHLVDVAQPPRPPRLGGGFGRAFTVGRLAGADRVAGLDVAARAPVVLGFARVVLGRARDTVGLDRVTGALRVVGTLRVTGALRVVGTLRVTGALRVARALRVTGALRGGEERVADPRRGCEARGRARVGLRRPLGLATRVREPDAAAGARVVFVRELGRDVLVRPDVMPRAVDEDGLRCKVGRDGVAEREVVERPALGRAFEDCTGRRLETPGLDVDDGGVAAVDRRGTALRGAALGA